MTEGDLHWAAGILEGEGCICIHGAGRRGYTILSVAVQMTDRDAIEEFVRLWPVVKVMEPKGKAHHKQRYEWRLRGGTAADFLRQLQPYLRTPRVRQKVALALEFDAARRQGSRDPRYKEAMRGFAPRMRALNARGAG